MSIVSAASRRNRLDSSWRSAPRRTPFRSICRSPFSSDGRVILSSEPSPEWIEPISGLIRPQTGGNEQSETALGSIRVDAIVRPVVYEPRKPCPQVSLPPVFVQTGATKSQLFFVHQAAVAANNLRCAAIQRNIYRRSKKFLLVFCSGSIYQATRKNFRSNASHFCFPCGIQGQEICMLPHSRPWNGWISETSEERGFHNGLHAKRPCLGIDSKPSPQVSLPVEFHGAQYQDPRHAPLPDY